ncbi:MAG: hypothetical protein HY942_03110 [Gammaproteobacteria bacterium]|nr:hypothetical protein [Gammaproteobacteria bacterium]
MKTIQTLPDPSGLYVLTTKGTLGFYNENKEFTLDTELSVAFAEHIAGFLKTYLTDPGEADSRIALIYNASEKMPWGHAVLLMEASVVRDLYPVTGVATGGAAGKLTAFQERNRINSIYRGMEALLGYKAKSNLAVYCPVLFDRHTKLDSYLSVLGREEHEDDKHTPVLEVLNLVANIPLLARNTSEILELREKLQKGLIKSDLRKDSGLAVVEHDTWRSNTTQTVQYSPKARAAANAAVNAPLKDFTKLHITDRHEEVERWLAKPPRTIDLVTLRNFSDFRTRNEQQLIQFAAQCQIYQAPAGMRLLERGMKDNWNLFLVSGTLVLEPQDGARLTIEGKTEKALNRVALLKPRQYTVFTQTPVTFLWVHDDMMRSLTAD